MQSRQGIGEAKQTDRAREKKERARRHCDNRDDVECETHPSALDLASSASSRERPFLTNAMEAKVARRARVNATSTAEDVPITAPSSSNAAMPDVPINCTAIM